MDSDGLMGKGSGQPNLNDVASIEDLARCMRALREKQDLSFRALNKAAQQRGSYLPPATLSDMLKGKRLPNKKTFRDFLDACDVSKNDQQPWLNAWERTRTAPKAPEKTPQSKRSDWTHWKSVKISLAAAALAVAVTVGIIVGILWATPDAKGHPGKTKPNVVPCKKRKGTWYCYTKGKAAVWSDFSRYVVGYTSGKWQTYNCRNEGVDTEKGGPNPYRWLFTDKYKGWVADRDIYGDTNQLPMCPAGVSSRGQRK